MCNSCECCRNLWDFWNYEMVLEDFDERKCVVLLGIEIFLCKKFVVFIVVWKERFGKLFYFFIIEVFLLFEFCLYYI